MEISSSHLWTSPGCTIVAGTLRWHHQERGCQATQFHGGSADREADGLIELHVDDGHGCGKETVIAELMAFLKT